MRRRWNPANHPRDPRNGRFVRKRAGWASALSDAMSAGRGLDTPTGGDSDDGGLADELRSVGAEVHPDGTATLYHHTTAQNAAQIRNTGKLRGDEDGVFFTTNPDPGAHAANRGGDTVTARVPLSAVELNDVFGNEAHLRVPTNRPGDTVDVSGWVQTPKPPADPREALQDTLEGHGQIMRDGPHYELARVVVPDRGQGTGSRLMQQLTDQADQLGVTLTLTPSTDFGGSSVARLQRFYRRFGFQPNKGRNRDYETRATMIRPPQGG